VTIRRGEDWGEVVPVPADAVEVGTDAELAALVEAGDPRPLRLTGGDVVATVGGRGSAVRCLPLDIVRVDADDRRITAVAHVVARGPTWWRGPIIAVLNADRIGSWDVAPRAHPNDGRLDVVEVDASMSVRARWQAHRRLPTGTHLPHPAIHTARVTARAWTFDRPLRLWVDGVERGTVRSLAVAVEPDGASVYV
jgi:YegS C-terminal NAD kinase beta sandwich-like domain